MGGGVLATCLDASDGIIGITSFQAEVYDTARKSELGKKVATLDMTYEYGYSSMTIDRGGLEGPGLLGYFPLEQ